MCVYFLRLCECARPSRPPYNVVFFDVVNRLNNKIVFLSSVVHRNNIAVFFLSSTPVSFGVCVRSAAATAAAAAVSFISFTITAAAGRITTAATSDNGISFHFNFVVIFLFLPFVRL